MALAAAQAAGAPVSIDTIAGWSGMLKAGRWSPLVVTITNAGPAVEAELAVTVTAGSAMLGNDTTRAARMGVQLPARSHRRFSLAMPVSLDMRTAVVTLSAAATATTGVMELGRQELALRDSIVTDRILVAVASELSLDYLAAGDPPTEAAVAAAPVATRLVYPHPEILPDSRAGWDAVDAVVFRDASFNRLRPAQVEALEQWVVAGGTLVISGGVPALDLAAEGMAALCPVEVTGIVERAGLPSLASLVPGPPPRARIVVAASRPRPLTRVLAAEDGIPVVAVRRLGAGSVTFVAFDAADRALAAWDGRPALWRMLTTPSPAAIEEGRAPRAPLEDPWIAPLASAPVFSFPSPAAAVGFLGAYAALAAALVLPPLRRLSRARVAGLIGLAAVACVSGWLVLDRPLFRQGSATLEAGVLQVSAGDGLARLERHLAVVATTPGSPTVEVGTPQAMIAELALPPGTVATPRQSSSPRGPADGSRQSTIELADRSAIRALGLGRYGSRLFDVDEVVPVDLGGSLVANDGSIDVTVVNRTSFPLRDAWLVAPDRAAPLGDIAAGAVLSRRLEGPGEHGIVIDDPVRRAFWERAGSARAAGGPAVIGWLDAPPVRARLEHGGQSAALCLVVLRFPQ